VRKRKHRQAGGIFLLAAAFLLAAPVARAVPLASEDFESYPASAPTEQWMHDNDPGPPDPDPEIIPNGGTGWNGDWNVDPSTELDNYSPPLGLFIRDGGLSYSQGTVSLSGGDRRLEVVRRRNTVHQVMLTRELPAPQDGTIYLGFLYRGASVADDFIQLGFDPHGALDNAQVTTGSVVMPRSNALFGVRAYDSGSHVDGPAYADGTTYLLVLKVWKSTGDPADHYDRATLFVNPDDAFAESGTSLTSSADSGSDVLSHLRLRLWTNLETGDRVEFDHIRVATTFAEVVTEPASGSLIPEPGAAALLALGGLLGLTRRRRSSAVHLSGRSKSRPGSQTWGRPEKVADATIRSGNSKRRRMTPKPGTPFFSLFGRRLTMGKRMLVVAVFVSLLALAAGGTTRADTNFICTIKASGGDYNKLSTWEAAIESDLTAASSKVFGVSALGSYAATDDGDTVSFSSGGTGTLKHINSSTQAYIVDVAGSVGAGDTVTCGTSGNSFTVSDTGDQVGIAGAECYNDFGPGGLRDNLDGRQGNAIDGWETDPDHFVKIYTPLSERHTGVPGTGFRIWDNPNGDVIQNSEDYTQIIGLEIENTRTDKAYTDGVSVGENSLIGECIARTGRNRAIRLLDNSTARNCLVYDSPTGIDSAGYPAGSYIYNCTVVGCTGTGVLGDRHGDKYWRNVLSYNNGTDFAYSEDNPRLFNCASSDGTADDFQGSGNRVDQTFSFLDEANLDFHLAPDDTGALDYGLDLSSDPILAFDFDIDDDSRPIGAAWDIGMDEAASEAPIAEPGPTALLLLGGVLGLTRRKRS
jgi:hypothetical protein